MRFVTLCGLALAIVACLFGIGLSLIDRDFSAVAMWSAAGWVVADLAERYCK